MRKGKTVKQQQGPRWRYFTVNGNRKKDQLIVRFTGEKLAIENEFAFITSRYDKAKGTYELRLEQDVD